MEDAERERDLDVVTLADRLGPPPTVEQLVLEGLQPTGDAIAITQGPAAGQAWENSPGMRVCTLSRHDRSNAAQPLSMPPLTSPDRPPATFAGMAAPPGCGYSGSRLFSKLVEAESARAVVGAWAPPSPTPGEFGMVVSQPC